MKYMPWIVIVYAFMLLGGGMVGFYTAHSWPSLIMGSLSAVVLIVCALSMFKNALLGYFIAITMSFAFTIFFSYRFVGNFKIMPSGLMAVVSFLVFLILVATKLKN